MNYLENKAYTETGDGSPVQMQSSQLYPKHYSMSVTKAGAGTPTYTAKLQASLDGVNWSDIIVAKETDGDGIMVFPEGFYPRPAAYIRSSVSALSLDTCTAINVRICATA